MAQSSRRHFLATAGALTAASLLRFPQSTLFAQSPDASAAKPLGWCFVGLGGFAQHELLPGISRCKLGRCVAVVTGHPEKVTQPNQKLGGKSIKDAFDLKESDIYSYDNFDSIKDNPKIDIVYIVLPNGMHCEYTVRAFKAGKHVMCEKPMANTAAEAAEMIKARDEAGKKLQIGYRMHWDALTDHAIAAMRAGEIGKIQSIEAASGFNIGPGVWRLNKKLAGGGSLMDIGIYSVSAAQYLSGETPVEVSNVTISSPPNDPRFAEVEADVQADLKFPSGVIAKIDSSYSHGLGRFAVHGSAGEVLLQPASGYMEPPNFGGVKLAMSKTAGGKPEPVDVTPVDQFVGELDGFSAALQGTAPFKATGEEGLQDMKIIDAIYKAGQSNQPVKLT